MKYILSLGLVLLAFPSLFAQEPDYATQKMAAEKLYADGSYARAQELYTKIDMAKRKPAEVRWVKFRLADTLWRAQAGTQTADPTKYEKAQHELEVLVRDIQRVEDRDRVWAEVQESLGDFFWARRGSQNWGQGWTYYQQALDWWAGAPDLEVARAHYLKIVWTIARPAWAEPYYYYGYYGNFLPPEVLENILKIAQTENDKAHVHFLLAMTVRYQGGDWERMQRVPEEFEAALKGGKATDWYDDALFNYAQWMEQSGRIIPMENGQYRQQPDYIKALELYRRFVKEHQKGETRYFDQAKQQIENLTRPVVSVGVSNLFLPDSEIQYYLSWRNVKRIDLALYPVDLSREVLLAGDASSDNWLQAIHLAGREKVKSWTKETGDKGDYQPGQETLRLDGKLPVGAYVLEAKGNGQSARDLILITDASLVVKTSGKQALVYFCNALNSAPLAKARVHLWERYYRDNKWVWREMTQESNADGIAVFDLMADRNNDEIFVSAIVGDRQAFSTGYSYDNPANEQPWRIYAFTDRPAYRPKETVNWKFVARRYNGSVYSTPADQTVEYEIIDPHGTKVKEGKAKLNPFGSAWGTLELTEAMPLGEYRINFYDEGRHAGIGGATLFRLEEYKLPEFKVAIETPKVGDKKKTFRLGEKVEVNIQADYYFGGPVANASVEVLVYQNPFYHWWSPRHDYSWYYEDLSPQWNWRHGGGNGPIIKRETLKTDAMGKATINFDTPREQQQDFEYRVEARVTDASRREIVGSDTLRVTRQRYYVYLNSEHYLYHPQDKVKLDIKALDANEQPVPTEGTVKVTRDYWYEIWLDPQGKEIKGDALKALQEKAVAFPPPALPNGNPWRLKFRGYQHDEILTRLVKTDAKGEAEFIFAPEREGYYHVTWSSDDQGAPIRAETTVWVATNATSDLGYRHGGVEIIVDKDTFHAGQKAPVMLIAPTNDRYVLFSVEGEDLYSYQLVHLTGTVKLIELPIEEKHVPNIFLSAAMVSDRQLFMDTKQVIVPPVENFLTVEVKPDRPQYQPREEGLFTVTTRDHNGKPVSAEVGFGLVDESVYYIQQDYAGDPRQFYYGTKRQQLIQTQSTLNHKSFVRLIEGEDKQLMDDLFLGRNRREDQGKDSYAFLENEELALDKAESLPLGEMRDRMGGGGRPMKFLGGAAVASKAAKEMKMVVKPASMPDILTAAGGVAGNGGDEPVVVVRSDFRSTILWQPDLMTDKDGKATMKVKYPDSLTGWKAVARVASAANQFGIADAITRTKQPLIVRLQAPRFFVVGDTVTISAVINNNTNQDMLVKTNLEAEGLINPSALIKTGPIEVKANSEARADFEISVQQAGPAKLKVTGRAEKYSDAMEKTYVIYEHGIEKYIAKSGKVRANAVTVKLNLPKERKPESTLLTVQVAPSMAVTMLDALPYLIDYPYGCTEQTMSRFLPAAITVKTLRDLGLQPEVAMNKVFGGIEQEVADKTHPKGKHDLKELDAMVKAGLDRLYDFQHGDGGWGWWKEGGSDHWMTAYVVWGLTLARDADIAVKAGVLDRGVNYLDKTLVEEEGNPDLQAFMLHALSASHKQAKQNAVGKFQAKAFDNLWTNRDKLNAYSRALLALSAHQFGYADKAKTLIQNLENGVKRDKQPDQSVVLEGAPAANDAVLGTAHWGEDGIWWRWSDGGVEATSFALRALLTIDPKNALIEPVTNWLIKNRRGAQWSNTRDTAITVLALNDYLRVSGELKSELAYEVLVNGHSIVKKKLTAEDALSAPSQFAIERKFLRDGENEIRIVRNGGAGAIYFAAHAQFFSLEEPVTPAGNEIFVRRQYYKLVGHPTLLKGYVYEKQPLNDNETVTSGERVEAVLTIESKNNYEFLLFEDLKPAGLEAVEIRSGENVWAREIKSGGVDAKLKHSQDEADYTGRTRWVYQELRDRKVALFIDRLPEGIWQIRYDLRAEAPGRFHALPVLGHAMYVPEIRCNGTEVRLKVEDKK